MTKAAAEAHPALQRWLSGAGLCLAPGNARELDNVLQRALLLREGDRVDACDLDIEIPASPMMQPARLSDASRVVEAELIRAALEETGGHRVRAAERLGISERTLRYRLAGMRSLAA